MKLTYKLLLAAMAIFLVIIIVLMLIHHDESKQATVISIEPIRSHRLIEYETCSVIDVLNGFNQEYLSRYHPAQNECKMVFMIQTLQKRLIPTLLDREYRKCVITQKAEQVIVSYDVVYRIDNTAGKVRMAYNPGLFIPLDKNGRLDLSKSSNQVCEKARNDTDALIPFYCLEDNDFQPNMPRNALSIHTTKNTYGYYE